MPITPGSVSYTHLVLACRGIAQPQTAAALLEEEPPLSDPFLLKEMCIRDRCGGFPEPGRAKAGTE